MSNKLDFPGPFGAKFSPCRKYRYTLWRWWDRALPYCQFIGLNPSTADERNNDPTVTRCINFARKWGYGGLVMTNIFAYRATDPRIMKAQADPIGSLNDYWLHRTAIGAGIVIAAWGIHGAHGNREQDVCLLLPEIHHLGRTKYGHPKHPLYLRADTTPVKFAG